METMISKNKSTVKVQVTFFLSSLIFITCYDFISTLLQKRSNDMGFFILNIHVFGNDFEIKQPGYCHTTTARTVYIAVVTAILQRRGT